MRLLVKKIGRFLPKIIVYYLLFLYKPNRRRFLLCSSLSFLQKIDIIRNMNIINSKIECAHTDDEIIEIYLELIEKKRLPGVIIECGCFKGGSTAKISLLSSLLNKSFYVFDSFEGIPENDEQHCLTIYNEKIIGFHKGDYKGSLLEVKNNLSKYGNDCNVSLIKGLFDQTLPCFDQKILIAYLDVDLVSSTKICLKYLYPNLVPGGVIFSQDAHLPLIVKLLNDELFWKKEIGAIKPHIEGLGKKKLIKIIKE